MIRIVIDAMGSDNGSPIVVEAIKEFKKTHNDVEFFVCGAKEELEGIKDIATIIDAPEVMGMEDGALAVMRKKDTSMMRAIDLVKDGTCDGVVSAGSTGAFLSGATIKLKMIEGVKRAALVSPFPTSDNKGVVMLDIGASNENTPEQLQQFALMGQIYSQCVMGREKPDVYLLSNGAEEKKGSPVGKEAYQLLKNDEKVNFKGNIEGRYILTGQADVVVCEGYAGNVMLKTIEGTASFMGDLIKKAFKTNLFSKIGYLLTRKGMKGFKETTDYKKYGGAMLLGVNGVVVKGHGSSNAYAFYNAIRVAYEMITKDVCNKVKEALK